MSHPPASAYLPRRAPVVHLDEAASFTLDGMGVIRDCNQTSESMFGYTREELLAKHITHLVPDLERITLVTKDGLNPHLLFACRVGQAFRTTPKGGEAFNGRLYFNDIGTPGEPLVRLLVRRAQGFPPAGPPRENSNARQD